MMPHQRRTDSMSRAGLEILPAGVEIFREVPFTLYRLCKYGNTFASINGPVTPHEAMRAAHSAHFE